MADYEIATSNDGDVYDAFMKAGEEIAAEKGVPVEQIQAVMDKLIYLFVTRI